MNIIPQEWSQAIDLLEQWRSAEITHPQWDALVDWLLQSPFGDKSYMAGEIGSQLIRDLAPDDVLDQFVTASSPSSWVVHFKNIASVGRQHPLRLSLLSCASQDSNLVVNSFARSVLQFDSQALGTTD